MENSELIHWQRNARSLSQSNIDVGPGRLCSPVSTTIQYIWQVLFKLNLKWLWDLIQIKYSSESVVLWAIAIESGFFELFLFHFDWDNCSH